jgi:hypothetical protein
VRSNLVANYFFSDAQGLSRVLCNRLHGVFSNYL